MKIEFDQKFSKKLVKLCLKDRKLGQKIDKKILLFRDQPTYPGLRLHKLGGKNRDYWSLTVEENLKIIFCFTEAGILLTDIGSHDEVY